MKTLVKFIVVIFITSQISFSAMITSDPTSYTYYAQQIKAFNDEIKNSMEQINILNDANKMLSESNKLIFESGEKIYNPTKQIQNLVRNLESTQNRFKNFAERAKNIGAERFFKDYHNVDEPLETEAYEKWKDNLEALFENSKDKKYEELQNKVIEAQKQGNYLPYEVAVNNLVAYLNLKKIEQDAITQSALKAPLEIYHQNFMSAEVVEERKKRAETVKNLLAQVNSEKDMLKQQQTTNQILIMLLETIDRQAEMQMQYQYAMTTLKYREENKTVEQDIKQVKADRENFQKAQETEQKQAVIELKKWEQETIKKGEQSEIHKLLEGSKDFNEY